MKQTPMIVDSCWCGPQPLRRAKSHPYGAPGCRRAQADDLVPLGTFVLANPGPPPTRR